MSSLLGLSKITLPHQVTRRYILPELSFDMCSHEEKATRADNKCVFEANRDTMAKWYFYGEQKNNLRGT
jgi:hypothetical protein